MKGRSPSSSIQTKRSSRSQAPVGRARPWTKARALSELAQMADPAVREKMAYFSVNVPEAHGISAPMLHRFARQIGRDHALANDLWASGIHEAKILATLIGEPARVTAAEMDRWARSFDSWDVVDAACCYLYAVAEPAWEKTKEWSRRREEYVKRAAFSLAAYLSYKDKKAPDARFEQLLRITEREAGDERHFVKKAVNWAVRNIGKRNLRLNRAAIRTAERIRELGTPGARWIASDALRELRGKAVQRRLKKRMEA